MYADLAVQSGVQSIGASEPRSSCFEAFATQPGRAAFCFRVPYNAAGRFSFPSTSNSSARAGS